MKRAAFLSLLILALLATGLALRDGSIVALSLPLLCYLAVGLIQVPRSSRLERTAQLTPSSTSEGTTIGIKVQVHNHGTALSHVAIEDPIPHELELIDGFPTAWGSLSEAERYDFSYAVRAARGLHRFKGVQVSVSDPFGLFHRRLPNSAARSLLVRPNLKQLRHVALNPLRTGVHAGLYRSRQGGPGVEFHGVRPYAPGDAQRWINWRASARHGDSLFVNEYEQERAVEIGIIVDARARSNAAAGGRSSFSSSIQAAASLSDLFLTQGNRVGLMLYGSHLDWTVSGYGRVQRERILLALARARVGYSQIFDRMKNLPTRLFPPLSQLIFISPVLQEDVAFLRILRARRYPILVVSPDRISAESELLKDEPEIDLAVRLARIEQTLITRSLTKAGIHRVVWDLSQPLELAIEMQAGRPRRWMRAVGARVR